MATVCQGLRYPDVEVPLGMLQEDANRFIDLARSRNPLDPAVPLGPLMPVLTAPGGS